MMINPIKYSKETGSTEKDNLIAALMIRRVLAQGSGCGAPYNTSIKGLDSFLDRIYDTTEGR